MTSLHQRNPWKTWLSGGSAVLIAGILYALTYSSLYAGGDTKAEQKSSAGATPAETQKLSGQDLYTINCNRCHAQRYPREWTPSQWKTLIMHMRIRANIPADQAREILKYMQEESSN
jgi:cytochrome c5